MVKYIRKWLPSSELLAQMLHTSLGFAFTVAPLIKGYPLWFGITLILIVDLFKELTFDQVVEGEPFFWDGLVDWSFYVLGCVVGVLYYIV